MIRSWIKTGAAGIVSRCLPARVRFPLVVGYHRVVEDFASSAQGSIPSMLISARMLEQQLDWIGRRFRFVSLDELGARLEAGDSGLNRLAAVTFDDGYRDFYEMAFPLLMRKGIPAALFVSTGFVGTRNVHTHDKLYSLLARRPGNAYRSTRRMIEGQSEVGLQQKIRELETAARIQDEDFKPFYSVTWEMLDHMQKCGITVGSHTRTHIVIPNESGTRAAEELTGSRAELEKRLGAKVKHFAYPGGRFDSAAVTAVAQAGYKFAYTTCVHRDAAHPQLTVPRILLWENACKDSRGAFSGPMMSCHAHRIFDVVRCRQRHTRSANGVGR
jgi:peptidoglycan/xylan/chitin deacetylase (PgdA/CDA1 family)